MDFELFNAGKECLLKCNALSGLACDAAEELLQNEVILVSIDGVHVLASTQFDEWNYVLLFSGKHNDCAKAIGWLSSRDFGQSWKLEYHYEEILHGTFYDCIKKAIELCI